MQDSRSERQARVTHDPFETTRSEVRRTTKYAQHLECRVIDLCWSTGKYNVASSCYSNSSLENELRPEHHAYEAVAAAARASACTAAHIDRSDDLTGI